MAARYAIYWIPPPESALARAAARWFAAGDAALTEAPRHYGFHATLKPPFALAAGATRFALETALEGFAAQQAPVALPPLEAATLGGFVALVAARTSPALRALAEACVETFDPFRRPLTRKEIAARSPGLTPRQRELLLRWGYPYLFDQWRFHLTLTGRIADPAQRSAIAGKLARRFAPALGSPVVLAEVSLCAQPDRAAPFAELRRYLLRAGRAPRKMNSRSLPS
jgi:hypothetical protein